MHKSVTYDFQIPGGIILQDGSLVKDVSVRGITGSDQVAILDSIDESKPMNTLYSVLDQCVLKLGPYEKPGKAILRNILLGDMETILLVLYKISTLEPVYDFTYTCSSCKRPSHDELALEEIPYKVLAHEIKEGSPPLEAWFYNQEESYWAEGQLLVNDVGGVKEPCFRVEDKDLGFSAVFKYPSLADGERAGRFNKSNPIDVKNKLFAICLRELGGKPVDKNTSGKIISDLPLPVLEFLDDCFEAVPPGPAGPIISKCQHCSEENELPVVPEDFLSRLLARQGKRKKRSKRRSR